MKKEIQKGVPYKIIDFIKNFNIFFFYLSINFSAE